MVLVNVGVVILQRKTTKLYRRFLSFDAGCLKHHKMKIARGGGKVLSLLELSPPRLSLY